MRHEMHRLECGGRAMRSQSRVLIEYPRQFCSTLAAACASMLLLLITSNASGQVLLSGHSAVRAISVSGTAPNINAPSNSSTTEGLGFSFAATISDPDLDSVS